jgi:hypothetical protein
MRMPILDAVAAVPTALGALSSILNSHLYPFSLPHPSPSPLTPPRVANKPSSCPDANRAALTTRSYELLSPPWSVSVRMQLTI